MSLIMDNALKKELHRIAITGIIYRKEGNDWKYLVTQRSLTKKAFPGKWTVPGGGLTIDDYIHSQPFNKEGQWDKVIERALKREIQEEVNLEIGDVTFLSDYAFIRPDNVPVMILSMYAPYASGDITLDADSIAYQWVSAEEAKAIDLIDGIAMQIGMVDEVLKRS